MRIRRYYKKGIMYAYTISDEYLERLKEEKGEMIAAKIDNASYEILLDTLEEERAWFFECCSRVLNNPRWYLDNADMIPTFKVHHKQLFPDKIY